MGRHTRHIQAVLLGLTSIYQTTYVPGRLFALQAHYEHPPECWNNPGTPSSRYVIPAPLEHGKRSNICKTSQTSADIRKRAPTSDPGDAIHTAGKTLRGVFVNFM